MTERLTVREACRRRVPLDGADAQALEHALTITERERDDALARVRELEAELARVQRLPEMDWASACAAFSQALAALARNGEQPAAQRALDVLDRLKTYVGRVVAERDELRAEVERLRGEEA